MSASTPPRTPTVAIARILRSLGLIQGDDFRVTGDYRNGERLGTFVLALTRNADETIAANADQIERLADEGPFAFRVSVRYPSGDRPMTTVANYGARVREEPPAPADEPEPRPEPQAPEMADPAPGPAAADPTPEPEPATPGPTDMLIAANRERDWESRQAKALNWSARQADLMDAAGAASLHFGRDGVLRHHPHPGRPGRIVADDRLRPLVDAGLLVITEPYGPGSKRVSITDDGRDALLLWRRWRPTPLQKDRHQEREPLRPLLGGQQAARASRAFSEFTKKLEAKRAELYAAMEQLHAWEDRDARLWDAWARVNGITYRIGRKRPAGWVPTDEEVEQHCLNPDIVAELRAEAARPQPRPELPTGRAALMPDLPPLPPARSETVQLDLFHAA
ncbi:hypothetical protein ACFWH1_18570 [Streptomyces sp. NPDC127037]|uniref:hypothetical protein n=1 Tax=Streptomyces sp. NPDC127037 TaxID=3347113 RepID=UPI00365AA7D6